MNSNQKRTGKGQPIVVTSLLLLVILAWGTTTMGSDSVPSVDLQGQEITLPKAIELAFSHNPELLGFTATGYQIQAEAQQAARGLNPDLDFEVENFAGSGEHSGFSAAEYTLALSQTFEMGGKRENEVAVVRWQLKEVEQAANLAGRMVESQVTQAFIEALRAGEEMKLAQELARLAEEDLELVRKKIAKGAVSRVEETRALVEVQVARLEIEKAGQMQSAARIRLSSFWNSTSPTFGDLSGNLESISALPAWDDLVEKLEQSPELNKWALEGGRRQAILKLAQSQASVDLTATAGVRHYGDSGDFAAVAAISIPLPTKNKNQDGQRAAQYGLDRLDNERQAQVLELLGLLLDEYQILSTTHLQITSIRDEILPSTEQGLVQSEEAYRKGLFNMTDVLEVRRTWFGWRQEYFSALAEYQLATAEIQRILGDGPNEYSQFMKVDGNE